MTALTCKTQWLIVTRLQISTILMKPTNGIQVALSGGLADRLIHGRIFSTSPQNKTKNAAHRRHQDWTIPSVGIIDVLQLNDHRIAADRSGLRYPSDLTGAEWRVVEPTGLQVDPVRPHVHVSSRREIALLPGVVIRLPRRRQPRDHGRRQVRRVLAQEGRKRLLEAAGCHPAQI